MEFDDSDSDEDVPFCRCDDIAKAQKRTVSKDTPNKGRMFWGCSRFPGGCNFFKWVDGGSNLSRTPTSANRQRQTEPQSAPKKQGLKRTHSETHQEHNELGNGTPGSVREIASSPIRNIHAVVNQKANVYIEKDTEGASHNVLVKLRSFDSDLRDVVKATPGRRYDAQRQVWIVSKEVKVSLIQNLLNSGKVEKVYDDSGEARKVYEENSVVVSDICMRVVNESTLEFKRPDNTTVASRVGIMPFVTKKSTETWSIPAVKFQELSALLQTSFGLGSTFLLPEGVQSILCKDDVFDYRQNFAWLDVFANRSRNINNGKLLLSTKQALRIPYNEVFATIETAQINVLILTDFLNEPSWLQLAKDHLNRGGALWNCGVFKIGADVISSLEGYDVVVVDLINIDGNASADVERIFTVLSASPNIQRTIITINHSALKFRWFEKVFHYLNTGLFTPDKFKQRYTQTSDNFLELETILKRKCMIDLDSVKFSDRKYLTIRWIRMPEYLESSLEIIKNTHIESNSKYEALLQIGNAYKFESVLEFLSLIVKIVNPTKEHKLLVLGNSCTWLVPYKLSIPEGRKSVVLSSRLQNQEANLDEMEIIFSEFVKAPTLRNLQVQDCTTIIVDFVDSIDLMKTAINVAARLSKGKDLICLMSKKGLDEKYFNNIIN